MRCIYFIGLILLSSMDISFGSDLDCQSTARQNVHKRRPEIIVLDAGHGGTDFGTMSKEHSYAEKDVTLALTLAVCDQLRRLGYRPILTRQSDVFVTLAKRAQIANSLKAGVFVSIHCNHSENSSAFGTEIYYYEKGSEERSRYSMALGQCVLKSMEGSGILRSRGVKAGNFSVIRETAMPSILVETGFLSNPKERMLLLSRDYKLGLAKGIAIGINEFIIEKDKKKHKRKSAVNEKRPLRQDQRIMEQHRPRRDSNTWPAA